MVQLTPGTVLGDNAARVRRYVVSSESDYVNSDDGSLPYHYATPAEARDAIKRGEHDADDTLYILALDFMVVETFKREWVSNGGV